MAFDTSTTARARQSAPGWKALIEAFGVLVLALALTNASPADAAGDPVAGKAAYETYCSGCHRANAPQAIAGKATADVVVQHLTDLAESGNRRGSPGASLDDILAYLATAIDYEGLWWNAPAGSEPGWGLSLAHQGDVIFATWYTYDRGGKGVWLAMTAPKVATGTYAGTLFVTTGPAFDATPFDPHEVVATAVGSGSLTFTDADDGEFSYDVDGVTQTKAITRMKFDRLPTCVPPEGKPFAATNYQDLWWAAPAGSESGWGLHLAHQGDTIVATWYTYDVDGSPMWLVATAPKQSWGVYAGTLYRSTGPSFAAAQFDRRAVATAAVGSVTLTFRDGAQGTFAYVVGGVAGSKTITRDVFDGAGTVCY